MNMSGAYIPKPIRRVEKAAWAQMSKAPLRPVVGVVAERGDFGLKSGQLLIWLVLCPLSWLLHHALPQLLLRFSLWLLLWQRLDKGKTNPVSQPRLAEWKMQNTYLQTCQKVAPWTAWSIFAGVPKVSRALQVRQHVLESVANAGETI
jgi:hypothetical protein